eukprot:gene2670-3866_t
MKLITEQEKLPEQSATQNLKQVQIQPEFKELDSLVLFADSIYQMSPKTGDYVKTSLESGWSWTKCAVHHEGYIYVVSSWKGCIYKWNVNNQNFSILNNEDWRFCRGMVQLDDYLYLICHNIYRVSLKTGESQKVSRESGWTVVNKNTACVHKGKILMIAGFSGTFIQWNPKDGSYLTVNNENWSCSSAIVSLNDKIYVISYYIYEVDVENGLYKKVSNEGGWNSIVSATVRNDKIVMLWKREVHSDKVHIRYANLYSFDPKTGASTKINCEDWINSGTVV